MSDEYRFINAYGDVYEHSGRAYVFIGSYLMFGIKPSDRKSTKIRKMKKWEALHGKVWPRFNYEETRDG